MSVAEMFDDQLLYQFMDSFYGSGHYTAPYWFVGMEEGGHGTFQEVAERLTAWKAWGCRELHELGDVNAPWFRPRAKIQPTWGKLIRILLSAAGQDPSTEQVREYQKTRLGRNAGDDCLLELLPLPSPSTGQWLYGKHSRLPYLANREAYTRFWAERRAGHIRQRVAEHHPKAVVFYSINTYYQAWWRQIAAVSFAPTDLDGLLIGRNEHTVFAITRHPAARGVTSTYFHEIGKIIAATQAQIDQ